MTPQTTKPATGTPTALHATNPTDTTPTATTKKESGIRKLLRKKQLAELLGVSSATVYRWLKNEGFPQPVKLSANTVAWYEDEVSEWLNSRERGLTTEGA